MTDIKQAKNEYIGNMLNRSSDGYIKSIIGDFDCYELDEEDAHSYVNKIIAKLIFIDKHISELVITRNILTKMNKEVKENE